MQGLCCSCTVLALAYIPTARPHATAIFGFCFLEMQCCTTLSQKRIMAAIVKGKGWVQLLLSASVQMYKICFT